MTVQLNPQSRPVGQPRYGVVVPADHRKDVAGALTLVGQIRKILEKMLGDRFTEVPTYFEGRLSGLIKDGRLEYSEGFIKLIADTLGIDPKTIDRKTLKKLFFGNNDHISASGLLARLKFYLPFILARKSLLQEGLGFILQEGAIFTKNFGFAKIQAYVPGLVKLAIDGSIKNFKEVLRMAAILALQSKDEAAKKDAMRLLTDLKTKDDEWWKKNTPDLRGRIAENFVYVYSTLFELRALQKRRLISSKVNYDDPKVFDNFMKRSLFTRFVATGGVDLKLSKNFETIDPTKYKFDYSKYFSASDPSIQPPADRPRINPKVVVPKTAQTTPRLNTENPLDPARRTLSFVA